MTLKNIRLQAIDLRKRGWSYNIIRERLGVAKSTLSNWLREVPYQPNRSTIKRIHLGPAKAAVTKQQIRLRQIVSLRKQGLRLIHKISRRDLLFLGVGLYMGEGTKLYEEVRIINSDPRIIKLAMIWFRKVCKVPQRNFVIVVHSYPDISAGQAMRFWARVTGIPLGQFERTQVDRRLDKSGKKRRLLPYGTAHIRIYSRGDKRFGVMLHRRIMGWIEGCYKMLRV